VEFIAHGDSEEEARYAVSVPLDRVMDETKDVLLAWEMNGQPLARDHGFPLRIVVPGVIGARSVKWVSDIRILSHESASFYQQRDYKLLPPQCEERDLTRYWEILPALQELNVQSAICEPVHKSNVDATKPLVIRGYAMGGGGRSVQRVEVTLDNGKTWHFADVFRFQAPHGNAGSLDRDWSWCLWSLKLDCAGMGDNVEIAARACMHPFVCHSV
jgi:sulfite oxidase